MLGIAEMWRRGPTVDPIDDPKLMGEAVKELMAKALPNTDMQGRSRNRARPADTRTRTAQRGDNHAINPDAVGAKGEPRRASWTSDDCLLYALGIGAGVEDPVGGELEFTTENYRGVDQKVFPTMVVLHRLHRQGRQVGHERGGTYDPRMMVHGEQGIKLHRPVPTSGEVDTVDEITGIYDKGKGAVVASKTVGTLVADGQPLYESTSSIFIVGEGGFGGDRGPTEKAERRSRPRPGLRSVGSDPA